MAERRNVISCDPGIMLRHGHVGRPSRVLFCLGSLCYGFHFSRDHRSRKYRTSLKTGKRPVRGYFLCFRRNDDRSGHAIGILVSHLTHYLNRNDRTNYLCDIGSFTFGTNSEGSRAIRLFLGSDRRIRFYYSRLRYLSKGNGSFFIPHCRCRFRHYDIFHTLYDPDRRTYLSLLEHPPASIMDPFLERYSSGSNTIRHKNTWKQLLKSLFKIVITYTVLSIFSIAIFLQYITPFIREKIPGIQGSIISAVLILLVISPFLRAIMMKKNHSSEFQQLWNDNKYNRGP